MVPAAVLAGDSEEGWSFDFIPYYQFKNVKGDVTVDGVTRSVDADYEDVDDLRNSGVAVLFSGRKGDWGFLVDWGWTEYVSFPSADELVRADIGTLEGTATYRWKSLSGLELLAGLRTYRLNVDYVDRVDPANNEDDDAFWLDPIVGARIVFDLGKRWEIWLKGDIGGFGAGSDLAWSALANIGWRVSDLVSLWGGYKYLDIDYEDGDFAYDASTRGFFIGLGFSF